MLHVSFWWPIFRLTSGRRNADRRFQNMAGYNGRKIRRIVVEDAQRPWIETLSLYLAQDRCQFLISNIWSPIIWHKWYLVDLIQFPTLLQNEEMQERWKIIRFPSSWILKKLSKKATRNMFRNSRSAILKLIPLLLLMRAQNPRATNRSSTIYYKAFSRKIQNCFHMDCFCWYKPIDRYSLCMIYILAL